MVKCVMFEIEQGYVCLNDERDPVETETMSLREETGSMCKHWFP